MKRRRFIFALVILIPVLIHTCSFADDAKQIRSHAEYPSTPQKVVEEYVRLDAEGVRVGIGDSELMAHSQTVDFAARLSRCTHRLSGRAFRFNRQ